MCTQKNTQLFESTFKMVERWKRLTDGEQQDDPLMTTQT